MRKSNSFQKFRNRKQYKTQKLNIKNPNKIKILNFKGKYHMWILMKMNIHKNLLIVLNIT